MRGMRAHNCSIALTRTVGTRAAHRSVVTDLTNTDDKRITTMKTISSVELATITGGTTSSQDAINTQLTGLQSSIKDLATAQTQKSSSSDPTTMMMMMMAMRPQQSPTVVAPAAAAPVAPGPVVNINTRVRRW